MGIHTAVEHTRDRGGPAHRDAILPVHADARSWCGQRNECDHSCQRQTLRRAQCAHVGAAGIHRRRCGFSRIGSKCSRRGYREAATGEDLLYTVEREQQRIGQDLHDGLCHQLAGIGFSTGLIARELPDSLDAKANSHMSSGTSGMPFWKRGCSARPVARAVGIRRPHVRAP